MYKLATNIPNLTDATSFFRAMGPLGELRRQWPELQTHHLAKFSWATLGECDALFIQRPYKDDELGIIEMAKDVGVPVWVDYDDFLFEVPTDNPAYFHYGSPQTQAAMKRAVELADVVTVSTQMLGDLLRKMNKNVVVIPNAIDMRYFPYRQKPQARKKRVMWRGSRTHHRDVFTVCQTIFAAQTAHKDWEWHFNGDNLWLLTDNMIHGKTFVRPPKEWPKYFRHIWDLAPAAMLAPLHEHAFNLCKSNIAWIEGAFAGAVTIAPNWEEWIRPGVLRYGNEKEFGERLEEVLSGDLDIEDMAARAWAYIQENLTLQKVNRLRREVLESIK